MATSAWFCSRLRDLLGFDGDFEELYVRATTAHGSDLFELIAGLLGDGPSVREFISELEIRFAADRPPQHAPQHVAAASQVPPRSDAVPATAVLCRYCDGPFEASGPAGSCVACASPGWLCGPCFRSHSLGRAPAGHTALDFGADAARSETLAAFGVSSAPLVCSAKHAGEAVIYYCVSCSSPMCAVCVPEHASHRFGLAADVAAAQRTHLVSLCEDVSPWALSLPSLDLGAILAAGAAQEKVIHGGLTLGGAARRPREGESVAERAVRDLARGVQVAAEALPGRAEIALARAQEVHDAIVAAAGDRLRDVRAALQREAVAKAGSLQAEQGATDDALEDVISTSSKIRAAVNVLLDADIILLTADMKRRLEVSYGRARVVRASLRTLNHSSLAFEADPAALVAATSALGRVVTSSLSASHVRVVLPDLSTVRVRPGSVYSLDLYVDPGAMVPAGINLLSAYQWLLDSTSADSFLDIDGGRIPVDVERAPSPHSLRLDFRVPDHSSRSARLTIQSVVVCGVLLPLPKGATFPIVVDASFNGLLGQIALGLSRPDHSARSPMDDPVAHDAAELLGSYPAVNLLRGALVAAFVYPGQGVIVCEGDVIVYFKPPTVESGGRGWTRTELLPTSTAAVATRHRLRPQQSHRALVAFAPGTGSYPPSLILGLADAGCIVSHDWATRVGKWRKPVNSVVYDLAVAHDTVLAAFRTSLCFLRVSDGETIQQVQVDFTISSVAADPTTGLFYVVGVAGEKCLVYRAHGGGVGLIGTVDLPKPPNKGPSTFASPYQAASPISEDRDTFVAVIPATQTGVHAYLVAARAGKRHVICIPLPRSGLSSGKIAVRAARAAALGGSAESVSFAPEKRAVPGLRAGIRGIAADPSGTALAITDAAGGNGAASLLIASWPLPLKPKRPRKRGGARSGGGELPVDMASMSDWFKDDEEEEEAD